MIDYHMHSYLCRHGQGEIAQYVEAALSKGLREIGFAEHIPIPDLDDPTGRMIIEDWDTYVHDVQAAQKNYPEITIRFGIEADYLPGHMDFIERFLSDYLFDYVIGSVHFVGDWDFSNPALAARLEKIGINELYRRYYDLIGRAASSGLYDIIGHLDLPKKIGVAPTIDTFPYEESALLAIQKNDLALDINTSGLRKGAGDTYPGTALIKRAFEKNIAVCLGSDAHEPDEVAADFEKTVEKLKSVGYRQSCRFNQRRRYFWDL